MQVHNYKKLNVWQKAMDLTIQVYEILKTFPKDEQYGISSQIKRSAISIPSNIAEGSLRNTKKDFAHFLIIALSSGAELETQLEIACRLKFLDEEKHKGLVEELSHIMKMLNRLTETLKV